MNSPKKPASKTASKTKKKYRKTKEELNAEGRERKRQKKHRGNKSGARYQEKSTNSKSGNQNQALDPRVGSKKPIPLVVDDNAVVTRPAPAKEPAVKVKLSPEQELEMLEQDDCLDSLLARLEDGETVTAEEQAYIDTCLDRIDELMSILGIELTDDDEEEDEDKLDDIMRILKSK